MPDVFRELPSAFSWSEAKITHRKHLPHLRQDNVIYFITFRLNDSLPEKRRLELLKARDAWLRENPPPHSLQQEQDYRSIWTVRIENLLDSGLGIATLRNSRCRGILEATMRHEDGRSYQLGEFVIMPNHVHLLIRMADGYELSHVLQTWKSISAKRINRETGRQGTLWMPEYFDHAVRDEVRLNKLIAYIKANPRNLNPDHYTLSQGTLPTIKWRRRPVGEERQPREDF